MGFGAHGGKARHGGHGGLVDMVGMRRMTTYEIS